MNISYRELCNSITEIYDKGEARAIVRLVLETRFGMSYTDIVCDDFSALSAEDISQLQAVFLRLRSGEPVQYVLGEAEFCGRMFKVSPGVLIPRPETSELAMMVCREQSTIASPQILDVCTGSGCIATTISLELPSAVVEAWDISSDALQIAKDNVAKLEANVSVVCQDALCPPNDVDKWDAVVSNPPYVLDSERHSMSAHVLNHEPALALFVPDANPLLFYDAIARYAQHALRKGGGLYFEINPLCASMVVDMLESLCFLNVEIIEDQFGKQRFVKAYKQ